MNNISDNTVEMEVSPVTILPHEIIEQLAELDLELSEGKDLLLKLRYCEWVLKSNVGNMKGTLTFIIFSYLYYRLY